MSSFPINDFQETDGFRRYGDRRLSSFDSPSGSKREVWGREAIQLEQERTARQEKVRRFFRNLIILLLGVLFVEILFQFFLAPRMVISSVKINVPVGFSLSDEEILEAAGLTGILHYYSVDPIEASLRLERIPRVAQAEVVKQFPRSLAINITHREPLAFSLVSGDGGTIPLVLDKQGMVFAVGGGAALGDLPVISGIRFPEAQPGMRLPEAVVPFLEQLNRLREESPALFGIISELKFVKRGVSDYDVLLFPRGYRIKVRIGKEINEDLLKYILMVLDVTHREGINSSLEELDFRSNRIVYRTREE